MYSYFFFHNSAVISFMRSRMMHRSKHSIIGDCRLYMLWFIWLICSLLGPLRIWPSLQFDMSFIKPLLFTHRGSHGQVGSTGMWRTRRVCRTTCTAWLWWLWPSRIPQWTGTGTGATLTHSWCPKVHWPLIHPFTHTLSYTMNWIYWFGAKLFLFLLSYWR